MAFFRVIEARFLRRVQLSNNLESVLGYRSHDESLALIDYLVIRYFPFGFWLKIR